MLSFICKDVKEKLIENHDKNEKYIKKDETSSKRIAG